MQTCINTEREGEGEGDGRGKERVRESVRLLLLRLLYLTLSCWNSHIWAKLKPGAKKSIQFAHKGDNDASTWVFCYLPRSFRKKMDSKWSSHDCCDLGCTSRTLN